METLRCVYSSNILVVLSLFPSHLTLNSSCLLFQNPTKIKLGTVDRLQQEDPEAFAKYSHISTPSALAAELQQRGLIVQEQESVDHDEVFLKIRAPESVLLDRADTEGYDMILKNRAGLGAYSRANHEDFQVWGDGSVLRPMDRQQLTYSILRSRRLGKSTCSCLVAVS